MAKRRDRRRPRWLSACPPLSSKAELHTLLTKYCNDNGVEPFFPQSFLVSPSSEGISEFVKEATAALPSRLPAGGLFVKHPRAGGGRGVFHASSVEAAANCLAKVIDMASLDNSRLSSLAKGDQLVVQRAVYPPLLLPLGPSKFDLRVWSVFTERDAFVFSALRARTAALESGATGNAMGNGIGETGGDGDTLDGNTLASLLTNKGVQRASDNFGKFYPWNCAPNSVVGSAVDAACGKGVFSGRTVPLIHTAIGHLHAAFVADQRSAVYFRGDERKTTVDAGSGGAGTASAEGAATTHVAAAKAAKAAAAAKAPEITQRGTAIHGNAFFWLGLDFLVDGTGVPWLLEVNVKKAARYAEISVDTFPVPLARGMAARATSMLPSIIPGWEWKDQGDGHGHDEGAGSDGYGGGAGAAGAGEARSVGAEAAETWIKATI